MVDLDQRTACETQWTLNYFRVSATITRREYYYYKKRNRKYKFWWEWNWLWMQDHVKESIGLKLLLEGANK